MVTTGNFTTPSQIKIKNKYFYTESFRLKIAFSYTII